MTKPKFQDDGQWGNGAHTASHKAAVSEANRKTQTGVWGAKRRYETKRPFVGIASVSYNEIIERMGIRDLIEQEGILSEVLLVFVRRILMENLFFIEATNAHQRGDLEDRDTYARYHQTYSKGAINDGLKLMEVLAKQEEGVIDLALNEAINENSQTD